jgi:CheY-like chemotaxis protein
LPDVVLPDIWMPQRDGFEAAEAIKHRASAPGPFILAYTCAEKRFVMANPAAGAWTGTAGKVPLLLNLLSSCGARARRLRALTGARVARQGNEEPH